MSTSRREQNRRAGAKYRRTERYRATRSAYLKTEKSILAQREYVRTRNEATYARVAAIKLERGCVDCGYKDHAAALDFDHVRGEKLFDISKNLRFSWERVEAEIAKCEVRCANCHRIKTYEARDHVPHPLRMIV